MLRTCFSAEIEKKIGTNVQFHFVFVQQASENPRAGQRKMWVCVKTSGELIEINLDRDRPISFDSKKSEIQWERASVNNFLKFKSVVESGNF